jgi:hypothetical protein
MDDVRRLLDRAEIADLLTRYTRAVDTGQVDGFDRVFTDDATIDYSASGGASGPVAEVKAWMANEAIPLFAQTQHLVGQVETDFGGGDPADTAHVTAYFWNPIRIQLPDAEPFDMEIGGLYEHDLVRTPDGWRSRRLVEHVLWRK